MAEWHYVYTRLKEVARLIIILVGTSYLHADEIFFETVDNGVSSGIVWYFIINGVVSMRGVLALEGSFSH